jgi:hypothetical protein
MMSVYKYRMLNTSRSMHNLPRVVHDTVASYVVRILNFMHTPTHYPLLFNSIVITVPIHYFQYVLQL